MGKNMSKKNKLIIGLCVCCLVVFCVSAYMVITQLIRSHKEAQAFTDLSDQLTSQAETASGGFHKYDELYAENHDLFGWIRIEGTGVDYPVMHTPNDPEYYLRHAFDGSDAQSGVPFLDGKCRENCGNYIIYSHHMNDGTMFATLLNYADKSYLKEHPVIQFDTLDGPGEYEVLGAFYSQVYHKGDKGVFRYYQYTDLTDEKTFNSYLKKVQKESLYDAGVQAKYGDQLLTLSTCSYHTANGRFVVVARKM